MTALVADTHTIIWYLSQAPQLSLRASNALDFAIQTDHPIYLSAISIVEVIYLVGKDKLSQSAFDELITALSATNVGLVIAPLGLAIAQAVSQIPRSTVPDMPDR
ncbi:MAG: type II toxin-antitoxin system VapC family toxin, partial [Acaryochloris sp. CRU_2_0]|nr:type II toxin-antitoxin system VapC family toxin [Acaryochloris sp. CRU_2_0]